MQMRLSQSITFANYSKNEVKKKKKKKEMGNSLTAIPFIIFLLQTDYDLLLERKRTEAMEKIHNCERDGAGEGEAEEGGERREKG